MRLIGKVLWWDARDKEGVIVDAKGNEFYFNASVFSDSGKTKSIEGRFVKFLIHEEVKHIACAKSVALVPGNSQSKARKTFEKFTKNNSTDASAA